MPLLSNLSIGQYHHGNSWLHRLDPRTKLLSLVLLIISIFVSNGILEFLLISIYLTGIIVLSKLPFRLILRSFRQMWWLIVSIIILHVFFNNRESVFPKTIGDLWQGLNSGLILGCQFAFVIIGAFILTLTTIPIRLADGLTSLFTPFRKIGIPIHQFPIMMLIVLHFIPILFAETEKLISVRKSRGDSLKKRNIFQKFRNLSLILAPLLRNSFRRADELALGMESRCYSGQVRTQLYPLKFYKADIISLIAAIIMLSFVLVFRLNVFI